MNLSQFLTAIGNSVYSKANINFLYEYVDNKDFRNYLEICKNGSMGINEDLPDKIEKMLKCCDNKGIKYLMLSMQLDITRFNKEKINLNRKIYLKLIREYGSVPIACRKKVGKSLKLNGAYNYPWKLKEFRTWSKKHLENAYDTSFASLSKAVKLSSESEKASEEFYEAFKKARADSHPTMLLCSLNNAAEYCKGTNLKRAAEISEELGYYTGYYVENNHIMLILCGTVIQIAKLKNDYADFFEFACIIDFYYEKLVRNIPNLREMYRPVIEMARKYALVRKKRTLKSDEVSNGRMLRNFIKDKIGKTNFFISQNELPHTTIYRMLNGETSSVLVKTLKGIVKAMNLEYSFKNPKEINYVLRMMKVEELFEVNMEKLFGISEKELEYVLLRGIFISIPDKNVDRTGILSMIKNRQKLLEYAGKDLSGKEFINRCIGEENGFYRGRSELFDKIVEILCKEENLERMISLYSALKSDGEIELINRYFREYARYSTTEWDFDAEKVLEKRFADPDYGKIAAFCDRLNMSELYGYICTWFFEGKDRRALLNILSMDS